MPWLYGQTWLWYLIAFAVGVALAWVLLVPPRQRRLRALEDDAAARSRETRAENGARPAPVEERSAVEEPVDRRPATDPALNTLDMFATGPLRTTTNPGPGGAAAAGLGAAGLGAAGRPAPRRPEEETTSRVPAQPQAQEPAQAPGETPDDPSTGA